MSAAAPEAQHFDAPQSVEQALAALGEDVRALAGGTDLLVQMRARLRTPARVVDLKRIPELMRAEENADGLRIGAACSTATLREQPELFARFPGLLEACALIGSEQIQGRASLGGNLCNASPAADTTPALLVNEAVCEVAGRAGRRRVPVREFCTGPGATVLGAGELLVALHLPTPRARSADAYLRLTPRTEMDIAVAGAAARVALDETGRIADARLALGALGPTAFLVVEAGEALCGQAADAEAFARAAQLAQDAARPIADKRGTVEYRRAVAGVLAKRALAIAATRAAAAR